MLALGGLHILGTERHESRRIDNQLRGRAGRQGDPGSSRFYVSFEDELMRLFGPERLDFLLSSKWPENEPIEHKWITKTIENAQKKVEAHNFEIRKHRLQYDDVMNHQRALIYEQRKRVLLGEDMRDSVIAHLRDFVEARAKEFASPEVHRDEWNLELLHRSLRRFSRYRRPWRSWVASGTTRSWWSSCKSRSWPPTNSGRRGGRRADAGAGAAGHAAGSQQPLD